jgi:hypothetical protein
MQRREKILAAVLGGLLLLMAAWRGAGSLSEAFRARHARIDALQRDIDGKQLQIETGREAEAQLDAWRGRSLPANLAAARTGYQNWLLQLADRSGLQNIVVDGGRAATQGDVYVRFPFTLRARASLANVTRFLHGFYTAGHLHQIRQCALRPLEGSRDLELNLLIEAVTVSGVPRVDQLSSQSVQRLAHAELSAYVDPITRRDPFAAYRPPPPPPPPQVRREPPSTPPPPPQPPRFDESKYSFLTAVLQVDDQTEAWIHVRPTGQVLRVRRGDRLQVGSFQAVVAGIGREHIELQAEGERLALRIGRALSNAELLPEPAPDPDDGADMPLVAPQPTLSDAGGTGKSGDAGEADGAGDAGGQSEPATPVEAPAPRRPASQVAPGQASDVAAAAAASEQTRGSAAPTSNAAGEVP